MTSPTNAAVTAVRTLTGLTAAEMPDDNVTALLEASGSNIKLAAADALEVVAGQIATSITSDDISLDGSKRATVLMARAARLRALAGQEAADADDGFYFGIVGGVDARPELTERGCW